MPARQFVPSDTLTRALVAAGVAVLVVGLVVGAVAPQASVSVLSGPGDAEQTRPGAAGAADGLSDQQQRVLERLAERDFASSGVDYQQLKETLNGTEYEAVLEEYEQSQTRTDGNRSAYRKAVRKQAAFTGAVERYETVYDRYQRLRSETNGTADTDTATPADDPSRVRAVAHELGRIEWRVTRLGEELRDRYRRLDPVTDENLTDERLSVARQLESVSRRQRLVERRTLVASRIEVTEPTERPAPASFTDPLVVAGRLTANGSAVANGTVELSLGNRTVVTQTGSDGGFESTLRPRPASRGVTNATVRYLPANDSAAATTVRTIPVEVARVDATVTFSAVPDRVAFRDAVRVSGRVAVDDAGVGSVPVVVSVGDQVLGRVETAADGTYAGRVSLPAGVPAGNRSITASGPGDVQRSESLTVVERTPDLSVEVSPVDERRLRVEGTLAVDRRPLVNRTVIVGVDGTTVGAAETGPNGSFTAMVPVPGGGFSYRLQETTRRVEVGVLYPGAGNLAGTEATAAATVTSSASTVAVGSALVLGLVAVGGVAWLVRRRRASAGGVDAPGRSPATAPETGTEPTPEPDESGGPDPAVLLAAATEAIDADPGRAVRIGYGAVRRRLEPELSGTDEQRTHWEFYRDCSDADLGGDALSALRDVTERYERVAYATERPDRETASATLDRVADLVDGPAAGSVEE